MYSAVNQMLHTVKDKTGYILDKFFEARNSDKELLRRYWQEFDGVGEVMTKETFLKLTPAESITRARREFQERGEYAATETVQRGRGHKEQVYRGEYGSPPGMYWK